MVGGDIGLDMPNAANGRRSPTNLLSPLSYAVHIPQVGRKCSMSKIVAMKFGSEAFEDERITDDYDVLMGTRGDK